MGLGERVGVGEVDATAGKSVLVEEALDTDGELLAEEGDDLDGRAVGVEDPLGEYVDGEVGIVVTDAGAEAVTAQAAPGLALGYAEESFEDDLDGR